MRTRIVVVLYIGVALAVAKNTRQIIQERKRDCSDAIANCYAYGKSVCTNSEYSQWVQQNCRSYCGMCACADALPNCADYTTSVCTNGEYADWVITNCPKFCNKCRESGMVPVVGIGPTTSVTGCSGAAIDNCDAYILSFCTGPDVLQWFQHNCGCRDAIPNCDAYGKSVCTNADYSQWVQEKCPSYCGLCATTSGPTGGGPIGPGSGCVYDGTVYTKGQTWNDGCKFSCSCVDGVTGKYQCTQICAYLDLPPQCSMTPPGPGKCCPTPSCPAGFSITLPPGYIEL